MFSIFDREAGLRKSRLKSPVTTISLIWVSTARAIESWIDERTEALEFGGR